MIRLASNLLTGIVALAHFGFLAAGLVWGLVTDNRAVKLFFLGCVVIAGIFGSVTAKTSILFTQALPGAVALLLVLATSREMRDKAP